MSTPTLDVQADQVKKSFTAAMEMVKSEPRPETVEKLRIDYLGRKGQITKLMEGLRSVEKAERPVVGKLVNDLRSYVETQIVALTNAAKSWVIQDELSQPPLDVSLPVDDNQNQGALHPVSLIRQDLIAGFHRLGFSVYDGPEIDLDYYNFAALNFPEHHPARDMQDTFFVGNYAQTVLRTHTSNIQVHAMLNERPPLRVVSMGRTYRCDSDLTHTPMFHQIEGFVVDHNISMGDLSGVIDTFIKDLFGQGIATRLRPSFFPFVEPGAEFDMQCVNCKGQGCAICKQSGWLEIGGCGMIHPNVFEAVDYDSEKYTGFAFGFGMDRMAMLKYNLKDLRQLFDGSQPFLKQFPIFR